MKNKIILLYKNGLVESYSEKKFIEKYDKLSNIKYIMIPYLEFPDCYIPIRPFKYLKFYKATLDIIYQSVSTDIEDQLYDSYDPDLYSKTFDSLIELINGLYNLFKFRAVSICIDEAKTENFYGYDGNTVEYAICPRRYILKLYDHENDIIYEIDTKDMGDLIDLGDDILELTPLAYQYEDRYDKLSDIFYVPSGNKKTIIDLPLAIYISDDEWRRIKKPASELDPQDSFLYKIDDFCIYYMIRYDNYKELLNINSFVCRFCGLLIYEEEEILSFLEEGILSFFDPSNIPSIQERINAMEVIDQYDYLDVYLLSILVTDVQSFLKIMIFLKNIFYYMRYLISEKAFDLSSAKYNETLKDMIILTNISKNPLKRLMLVEKELTPIKIMDAFLSITK